MVTAYPRPRNGRLPPVEEGPDWKMARMVSDSLAATTQMLSPGSLTLTIRISALSE